MFSLAGARVQQVRLWHREPVAKERAVAAQREEQRRPTCALVPRAVSVAQGQGRYDLAQAKDGSPPCNRAVDCRYLVDRDVALIAGGREDLVAQLRDALYAARCDDGLEFARKHGIAAFRDFQERLDQQTEDFFYTFGPAIHRHYKRSLSGDRQIFNRRSLRMQRE